MAGVHSPSRRGWRWWGTESQASAGRPTRPPALSAPACGPQPLPLDSHLKEKKKKSQKNENKSQECAFKARISKDEGHLFHLRDGLERLTLRPDRLGDRAGVTEAVGVDRSDDEEVDGVGEEPHHRVLLLPHLVSHRLPSAPHRLAERETQRCAFHSKTQEANMFRLRVCLSVRIWNASKSLIMCFAFSLRWVSIIVLRVAPNERKILPNTICFSCIRLDVWKDDLRTGPVRQLEQQPGSNLAFMEEKMTVITTERAQHVFQQLLPHRLSPLEE